MKRKLFVLITSCVILFGGGVAIYAVELGKDSDFGDNVKVLSEAVSSKEYNNAKNYKYQDGEICCKGAILRTCDIGYFCSGNSKHESTIE